MTDGPPGLPGVNVLERVMVAPPINFDNAMTTMAHALGIASDIKLATMRYCFFHIRLL